MAPRSFMSEKPRSLSKRIQWRAECMVHSAVEWIASVIPGPWVFRAGEAIAGLLWCLMPRRRQVVLRNLRIAYADEMELAEIRELAKASFKRSVGNLLSGAHTAGLSPKKLDRVLQIENGELLQKFADQGKGVVILLSHMGNWELLSRLIHFIPEGVQIGGMYRPLNNPYMDERVRVRRQADGSRMFSKRDPFHQITGFLREGGIVGVLADQRVGKNGDRIQFFGRVTKASPLPSLLARRAKAEVVALSLKSSEPGKWKANFRHLDSKPTTEHCMMALEDAMRESPQDVFWLQERWKVRLGPGHDLGDLLDGEKSDKGKSHRALLWLNGGGDAAEISPIWHQPDVVYEVAKEPGASMPPWLPDETEEHAIEHASVKSCRRCLKAIDEMQTLPLDFVLATEFSRELWAACKKECIPLYIQDGDRVGLPRMAQV